MDVSRRSLLKVLAYACTASAIFTYAYGRSILHYIKISWAINIILETPHWLVVLKNNQAYWGSCTLRLKRKADKMGDLRIKEWYDLLWSIAFLEDAVQVKFGAETIRWACLMNHSYRWGMRMPLVHVHFHALAEGKKYLPNSIMYSASADTLKRIKAAYREHYEDYGRSQISQASIASASLDALRLVEYGDGICSTKHWNVSLMEDQTCPGSCVFTPLLPRQNMRMMTDVEWLDFLKLVRIFEQTANELFFADPLNWTGLTNSLRIEFRPRISRPLMFAKVKFEDNLYGSHYDVDVVRKIPEDARSGIRGAYRQSLAKYLPHPVYLVQSAAD